MTSLRSRADHQDVVSRRLALLTAELARADGVDPGRDGGLDDWTAGHTRVRALHAVPEGPPAVAEPSSPLAAAPRVPVPGRHAARRARPGLVPEGLVPGGLRGRVVLGPSQLVVVAVLVIAGLVVAGWWLVRGEPARIEAPSSPALTTEAGPGGPAAGGPAGSAGPADGSAPAAASRASAAPGVATGPTGTAAGSAPAGSVTVDVTGKVRKPGIVVLEAGARVVDAVEAAGGARAGVDLSALNLARVIADGEQIVVGGPAPPAGGAAAAAGSTAPGPPGALVNLNTASATELEALPQVGPVTAQAIVAWRTEHGGFTAVDELLEVDGIGDATLAQIAPHATV